MPVIKFYTGCSRCHGFWLCSVYTTECALFWFRRV